MKKIISVMLTLFIIISTFFATSTLGYATTQLDSESKLITSELMQAVAMSFAHSQLNGENTNYSQEELKVSLTETMYDFKEVPSAYKFEIYNEKDEYVGYIIMGAQEKYAPIIEFGFSDEPINLNNVLEEQSKKGFQYKKIYYVGGIDYIVSAFDDKNALVYINPETENLVNDKTIKNLQEVSIIEKNSTHKNDINEIFDEEWDCIYKTFSGLTDRSTIGPITDPKDDVSRGFRLVGSYEIPGASNVNYSLMSDFSGYTDHCGPTAATNYFKFHNAVNGISFNPYNWNQIFSLVYAASNCNNNSNGATGTYDSNLSSAMTTIWEKCNYNNSSTSLINKPSGADMVQAINNGNGVLMLYNNHEYYGNHFVLGYGYQSFSLNNICWNYTRIADGWSNGTRYVYNDPLLVSIIISNP